MPMFNAFLGKIENFLEKDFLFASLLPTLLFLACLSLLLGDAIGYQALLAHYHSDWSTTEKTILTIGGGLGIIIFAYLVYGLRSFFLRLWSGDIPMSSWYFKFGEWHFRKKFLDLRNKKYQESQWDKVTQDFRNELGQCWSPTGSDLPFAEYEQLLREARSLHKGLGTKNVKKFLNEKLLNYYKKYNGNGKLKYVHRVVIHTLLDWTKQEKDDLQRKLAILDRNFGDISAIRPTALGNVVESYNMYSYKRYQMEGEIFWPHLNYVIPKKMLERIRDIRVLLDFFLTMASLGVLVALLSILGGPFLSYSPYYWYLVGTVALIVSYFLYYKMAVFIAIQYGDLIRASYDLFRLELLNKLFRVHPPDRATELKQWKQLSQLLVYGDTVNYSIRQRETGEGDS